MDGEREGRGKEEERGRDNREQTSLQMEHGAFFLPHKSSCSLNWSIGNNYKEKCDESAT